MRAAGFVVAVLVAGTLASCAHAPKGAADQTLSLLEGQSAELTRGGRVQFANVVNDSRCPKNVTCVWAGTATVLLKLIPEAGDTVNVLAVLPGGVAKDDVANQIAIDTLGTSLTLVELEPYPVAGASGGERKRALVRVGPSKAP
jgi:hypothetical protein